MVWIDCGKTALSHMSVLCTIAASSGSDHKHIKGTCYAAAYSIILFSPFFCSFINELGLRFGGEEKMHCGWDYFI
jgi:hypothetical protein